MSETSQAKETQALTHVGLHATDARKDTASPSESQDLSPEEDPEETIKYLEEHLPEPRPELGSVAAFRVAIENVLAAKGQQLHFVTTRSFRTILWIWSDDLAKRRAVAIPWNEDLQVSVTIDRSSARNLAKELKPIGGSLTRFVEESGLTIGDVEIPWTRSATLPVPDFPKLEAPYFILDQRIKRLKEARSVILTRDLGVLRFLAEPEQAAVLLPAFGWPDREVESEFSYGDLRLLFGEQTSEVDVYCRYIEATGQLELTTFRASTRDDTSITTWTVVTGAPCQHPTRYKSPPDIYDELGLNDEEAAPSSPVGQSSSEPATSIEIQPLNKATLVARNESTGADSIAGNDPPWCNFVWRPRGSSDAPVGPRSELVSDPFTQPLDWNRKVRVDGGPLLIYVELDGLDFLDDDIRVNSMRERIWLAMCQCTNVRWLLCTRTPEKFESLVVARPWYSGWPRHIWPGAISRTLSTVEEYVSALVRVPSLRHWVWLESLTEVPTTAAWLDDIDQVIVGGECGTVQPEPVQTMKDQCRDRKTSFFFASWGLSKNEAGKVVEVLGVDRVVPTLCNQTHTGIPGVRESFEPRVRPASTSTSDLHLERLPNVGNSASASGGITIELHSDSEAPQEGTPYEQVLGCIKKLCAAQNDFKDGFDFEIARLLLLARRDFERRGEQVAFESVACELGGLSPAMVRKYMQIARELSRVEWTKIPMSHRKITHLLDIARLKKQGFGLSEAIRRLEASHEPKETIVKDSPSLEKPPLEADARPAVSGMSTRQKRKTFEFEAMDELKPGSSSRKEHLPGYELSVGIPIDGVTVTREYLDRILREKPRDVAYSLAEAHVKVRVRTKPVTRER